MMDKGDGACRNENRTVLDDEKRERGNTGRLALYHSKISLTISIEEGLVASFTSSLDHVNLIYREGKKNIL